MYLVIMLLVTVIVTGLLVLLAVATDGELGLGCQAGALLLVVPAVCVLLTGMALASATPVGNGGSYEAWELSNLWQKVSGTWVNPGLMEWYVGIFLLGVLVIYLVAQAKHS